MDETTTKEAKQILSIIRDAQKHTTTNNFSALFSDCETLISGLAWLISPITEAEQAYRTLIVHYTEDIEMSTAAAKEKAKASEEYKNWRKLEMVYKLADEQIKVLKKFQDNLGMEYKR